MAKIHRTALVLLFPFAVAFGQQTIVLNDGTQFQGRFDGGTPNAITFIDQNGTRHRFNIGEIQTLTFNSGNFGNNGNNNYNNSGSYNPPPPPNNAGGYNNNNGYNAANQPYPNQPNQPPSGYNNNGGLNNNPNYNNAGSNNPGYNGRNAYATLPATTEIAVRTRDSIEASNAQPGRSYAASINRDVVDASGNVVIPQGSDARLVVRNSGNNEIVLDLQSVNVNGQNYVLNTQDVTQTGNRREGIGANKRTGEYVGGAAVLGTLLGAIAGGGKGAAIGALAGAAAGAGAQVLTRGSSVHVPAETMLTFRLDQPVYLYQ